MARRISVTPDQQFERLKVIREVEPTKGKRRVLCLCTCGEHPVVDLYQLIEGRTKSCGCLGREKLDAGRVAEDLTGQTFGRIKALHPTDERVGGSVVWVCECSCSLDKLVHVPARDLSSGNTRSCGCISVEHAAALQEYNEKLSVDGVFVPLLRQKIQTNNKTGVKGVSIKRDKKGNVTYMANITVKGKRIYLGVHPTIKLATEERRKAEEKYHKPYLEGGNNDQTN